MCFARRKKWLEETFLVRLFFYHKRRRIRAVESFISELLPLDEVRAKKAPLSSMAWHKCVAFLKRLRCSTLTGFWGERREIKVWNINLWRSDNLRLLVFLKFKRLIRMWVSFLLCPRILEWIVIFLVDQLQWLWYLENCILCYRSEKKSWIIC